MPFDAPVISDVVSGSTDPTFSIQSAGSVCRASSSDISQAQARLLPGIDAPCPSRLKDSVMTILELGCNEVDCILVRVPGVECWDLSQSIGR